MGATRGVRVDDDGWEAKVNAFTDERSLLDVHTPSFVTKWHAAAMNMKSRTKRSLAKHYQSFCQNNHDEGAVANPVAIHAAQSGPQSIDALLGVPMPPRTPRQTVFDREESLAGLRELARQNSA